MQGSKSLSLPPQTGSAFANLRAYLSERFPVPVTFMLSLTVGAAAYATAQAEGLGGGAPVVLDGVALGGVFMMFLLMFLLRVFDEHKDFAIDSQTRPDRPVQRGLITLAQLKVLGAIAVVAQIALALTGPFEASLLYAAVLGYALLMYVEFFAAEWLAARIHWYALSHTLIMSLLVLALGARFGGAEAGVSAELMALAGLAFISSLAVDVLRKTWAPESEVDGLDSWSKQLGLRGAAVLGTALLIAAAGVGGWIGVRLGGGIGWIATVSLVTAASLAMLYRFVNAPRAEDEKKLEMVAGVHTLVMFLGIVVVAAMKSGVVFSIAERGFTLGAS